MKIKVLMITYNRPAYTKMALEKLCQRSPENVGITVWDNNSNQDLKDVLKHFENHPRVERIVYNTSNDKLLKPTNWFWSNAKDADLLGKVDDDCLVPNNWIEVLTKAHSDIKKAGVLGCWRFLDSDFMEDVAMQKICKYGSHQIMRNCWVEGSGYLMKRTLIDQIGILKEKDTFTSYCIKAAMKGYINGWYFPFLYQEHMDDPMAEHTGIHSEEDFQRLLPLSAVNFGTNTIDAWNQRLRKSARNLQMYSYNPHDFMGLRAKIASKVCRLFKKDYFPKAK